MGINITHTMNNFNFEGRENLKNTARDILNRQGASKEAMQNILDKSLFESRNKFENNYLNPQLAIIKASSQITQNNKLTDTFKYLKSQAAKKSKKEPVLGELWGILNEKEEYTGELVDFEIDAAAKNIFIAA